MPDERGIERSPIERVARVIERAIVDAAEGRADTEASARAVIEAMREPSDAMITAGIIERHDSGAPEAWSLATANIWKAMIDEALR